MKGHENAPKVPVKQRTRSFRFVDRPRPGPSEPHSQVAVLGPATSVRVFVESVFIPRVVEPKSRAGRVHYHSILKYILTPASVDQLFHRTHGRPRLRENWPYLDNVSLCDLTADKVRQLISCASSEGYSPQTLKHIRNVIGTIIKHAMQERVFHGDNPIRDVHLPTMTRRQPRDLTIEQAKTILRLMRFPEREVALLTICTGLGVPEICALRWSHVNLTNRPVNEDGRRIPPRSIMVGTLSRYGEFRPVQPRPDRCVAISDTLAAALMELRQRYRSEDPNDLLFKAQDDDPQSPLNFRSLQLKPISKELQMPWLSWQVLKRSHQVFLEELRIALTDALVSSTFGALSA